MWDENEFKKLIDLRVEAPPNILTRFQRRMRVLQIGRDLVERQAFAFWIVLDTLLRVLFGKRKSIVIPPGKSK